MKAEWRYQGCLDSTGGFQSCGSTRSPAAAAAAAAHWQLQTAATVEEVCRFLLPVECVMAPKTCFFWYRFDFV